MKLGKQAGLGRVVLDGDPGPPTQKGHSPQFSAHVHCGQRANWVKMPLGMQVAFSALTLLVGRQEGHSCKKHGGVMEVGTG